MEPDTEPTLCTEFPILLVIDATRDLLVRCREAATHAGLLLRLADAASAHALAKGRRIAAIVVPENAFWRAAVELDLLAAETNACLIPVANDATGDELEGLVAAACTWHGRIVTDVAFGEA